MYAYKNVFGFQAAKIHLLQPNGLLSNHWKQGWISESYKPELKQTHFLVKDLFCAVMRCQRFTPSTDSEIPL